MKILYKTLLKLTDSAKTLTWRDSLHFLSPTRVHAHTHSRPQWSTQQQQKKKTTQKWQTRVHWQTLTCWQAEVVKLTQHLQQRQQRTLTNRGSQRHLNPPCQANTRAGECVCVVTQQIKGAHAVALGAGRNLWRCPLGYIWGRLMDQPSAYWWASLMLIAVMSHNACQQHGEDREPFNLLIPSGINDTVMLLETNMTDITRV